MKLNKIETVGEQKIFQIRETTDDGKYHRRIITPDMNVSKEDAKIQETAEKVWTNEVKDAYAKHQEEAKKNSPLHNKE